VGIMNKIYKVRKVVRGKAEGKAVVFDGSFSFLGDVDMGNGEIIAEGNPNKGKTVKDKILIYKETKGSSGGMVVLMTLARKKLAPAAIVTVKPVDYNLAEGAILAQVPFVCEPEGDILNEIKTGDAIIVDANEGIVRVNKF
jgi:uncharacterized protein